MSMSPENPYDPNPFGDPQASASTALPSTRPGALTAVCVIAIVLGVMGVMSSGWKGLHMVVGRAIQNAITSIAPQPDPDMAKAQREMNDAIFEETDKFLVPNILLTTAQFAICIALVFGGLKSMGFAEVGRKVLVWGCCFIIIFELSQLGVYMYMQTRMMPIMQVHMSKMMEAAPNSGQGGEELMNAAAKFGMIVGFIFAGGWVLIKVAFFGFAIWHLRSRKIVALFSAHSNESNPAPAS